jgi:hypothetical protein
LYLFVGIRRDIFIPNLSSNMEHEPKCTFYKHLVDNFCFQYHLEKSITKTFQKCTSKLRLSSQNLLTETGRHKNIPRDQRFCKTEEKSNFCSNVLYIFNFELNLLKNIIEKTTPPCSKFTQLLSVNNVKELCNLAKYIYNVLKVRTDTT